MERFKTTGVGKGSTSRVNDFREYGKNHDRIWGKKKNKKERPKLKKVVDILIKRAYADSDD